MGMPGYVPHGFLAELWWFIALFAFVAFWIYGYIRGKKPLWNRILVGMMGCLLSAVFLVAAFASLQRLSTWVSK